MGTDDPCTYNLRSGCAQRRGHIRHARLPAWAGPLSLIALVAAMSGTATVAKAQLQSIAGASYEYIPRANLDPRPPGMEDLEIGFSTARAWATVPIPLADGDTVLLPGVDYAVTVADTENDRGNSSPDSFHEIGVSLGLIQRIGESWRSAAGRQTVACDQLRRRRRRALSLQRLGDSDALV